jgi:predicted dehydrogenase
MGRTQINRRDFIKLAAGAALGFPYIVRAAALGKDGAVAPSNRIVMGCIGVGRQGTFNMKEFLANKDVQITAVCEVDAKRLESAKNLVNETYGNGGCSTYHDFRELLECGDIDAVTICTPDHWHGLVSIAAAKAGKDIYCEKPLTNTIREGRAVCDAVKRYGVVLQTGSHERSNGSARFGCELVLNGRIGKVHTIRINMPFAEEHHMKILARNKPLALMPEPEWLDYDFWLGPAKWSAYHELRNHFWWRFVMDFGGGEMTDRGAHIIDLAQLGNGTDDTGPVELSGRGTRNLDGPYDTFNDYKFECKYANGVTMIGENTNPRGVKFEGTDGWVFIHIHGGRVETEPKSLLRERIGPNEIRIGRGGEHHRNFLDRVIDRGVPTAPTEVGHRTGTICHLLNIAMITEKKIKWNPESEQVIYDNEVNRMIGRPMRSIWSL